MKLTQILAQKVEITELSVPWKNDTCDFYIKPLGAGNQEVLIEQFGDSLPALKKLQEAAAKGEQFADVTGKDFVLLQTAKRKYAAFVLCDENGKLLYKNYNAMVNAFESELLDLIADKIEFDTKDAKETVARIEKNSQSRQD